MEYKSIIYRGSNDVLANAAIEHLNKCMKDETPISVEGSLIGLVIGYENAFDDVSMEYIVCGVFEIPLPNNIDIKNVSMEIALERKLKVSETYIIGVDIDENIDESSIAIGKAGMEKLEITKTYRGKEAVEFYNKHLEKEKNK